MFYHKFEAIASWYGYDYQGVLAIYYTIKKMNELINDIIEKNGSVQVKDIEKVINGYSVELEYMEDFAIKFNNIYQSFHQVKSGESKIKDEDIRDLYLKLLEYDNKEQSDIIGYFHVNENGKITDIIQNLEKQINTYFDSLKSDFVELKSNEKIDFRGKKGSAIKILSDYMNERNLDRHNKEKRIVCIEKLIEKLQEIQNKYFDKEEKYKTVLKRLLEYEEVFDSINDIEEKIIKELEVFHKNILDEEYKTNKNYLEKEKSKIGVLINKHIDRRKEDNSIKEIRFEEFLGILIDDLNQWGYSNEYFEYKFKQKLYSYYYQYKLDNEDIEICNICDKQCYLKEQLETIKGLTPEKFKRFLNNISIDKRRDYFDFPSAGDIRQTIFSFMCENHNIGQMNKSSIGIVKNNNEYWIIASLEDNEIYFIKRLFKEENDNKNILRDADILITKYINIDDITTYNKYFKLDKNDMNEVVQVNMDEKYNEINNYTKNRVSAVKKWIDVKGELV